MIWPEFTTASPSLLPEKGISVVVFALREGTSEAEAKAVRDAMTFGIRALRICHRAPGE